MVDCDNLLTSEDVLWKLMRENKTIVAPMLESRAAYSNFWCGMTSQVLEIYFQLVSIFILSSIIHVSYIICKEMCGDHEICFQFIFLFTVVSLDLLGTDGKKKNKKSNNQKNS